LSYPTITAHHEELSIISLGLKQRFSVSSIHLGSRISIVWRTWFFSKSMPLSLQRMGTPPQVKEYCLKLIDLVGKI
jgi:hypothetical protein